MNVNDVDSTVPVVDSMNPYDPKSILYNPSLVEKSGEDKNISALNTQNDLNTISAINNTGNASSLNLQTDVNQSDVIKELKKHGRRTKV